MQVTGGKKRHVLLVEKIRLISPIIFILLTLTVDVKAESSDKGYKRAIKDTKKLENTEISTDLIPISQENKDLIWNEKKTKILVCTWKSQKAAEELNGTAPKSAKEAIWVTVVPQVKEFCKTKLDGNEASIDDKVLRLRQYMGLKPKSKYEVFVEMWVAPAHLFRPCYDPEICDKSCQRLEFSNTIPKMDYIDNYEDFFNELKKANKNYPWTRLGYTYDWGEDAKKNHEGASEFIIAPGAKYEIVNRVKTIDYCIPDNH